MRLQVYIRRGLDALRVRAERGQSTVEYVLILALISVPLSLLMLKLVQLIIRVVVQAIVTDFSNGPI